MAVAAPPADLKRPAAPTGGDPIGDAAPGEDPVVAAQRKLEAMIAALESGRAAGVAPPPLPPPPKPAAPAPAVAERPVEAERPIEDGASFAAGALADDPFAAADAALAADGFGALPGERSDPAADRTRGALAEMFGLTPAELAAREEADRAAAGEEADREPSVAETVSAEAVSAEEECPVAEEPVPEGPVAEDSIIEGPPAPGPVAEVPAPEPVAEAAGDEPEPSAEISPAAGEQVGDEVSDYMEGLLARMREKNPAPPTATPKPAAAPKPAPVPASTPDAAERSGEDPAPAELPPPAAMPRPKIDKEKLREEMRQLRAIANSSARSAVMEATWRRTRTRLVMEVVMCAVALGLGLTLILTSVWGVAVHWVSGGAVCCAAVWIARDFGRSVETLRKQQTAAAKAAKEEAKRTGVAPKESPRALDVPAGHAPA